MKLIGVAFGVALMCAATLGAQTETKTTTKTTIKGGKSVKVTGCVESMGRGPNFALTHVADKSGALHDYLLVTDSEDLGKHVGHRVQLDGRVADRGDVKIETETKTKTKAEDGDRETVTHHEAEGDQASAPYLTVKSVKMIAAVCP